MLSCWTGRVSATLVIVMMLGASALGRAQTPSLAPDAPEDEGSNSVRIVRLSQVRGSVQMDRNTGRGYEQAFANIPVIAGAKLRTGDGVAEIEFEDNSSMRIAPWTVVRFSALSRTTAGATVSHVEVGRGVAYVSLQKTKGNEFALTYRGATVMLSPGTHLRLDGRMTQEASLALFEGDATLSLGGATTALARRETVTLNPERSTVSVIARRTEEEDYDAWDKQETAYHRQTASLAGTGGFGLYGVNDLSYYGSFVDMPGCGSLWRPYFANAAWDPFGSGVWTWYPGVGYSWVSVYPWGWLPFHSGDWAYCGAGGWGWRPGGRWRGLTNVSAMRFRGHPLPHPVPKPPERNGSTLVPVNMDKMPVSRVERGNRFTFRENSAGLGVPRGEFGNLRAVSSHADQRGGDFSRSVSMSTVPGGSMRAYAGEVRGSGMGGSGREYGTTTARASFAASSSGSARGGSTGTSSAGGSASTSSAGASGGSSSASAGGGRH